MKSLLKLFIHSYVINPNDRSSFLYLLGIKNKNRPIKILDVGCGNESVTYVRNCIDDIYYVGIDVGEYNTSNKSKKLMDEYYITSPEDFHKKIDEFEGQFDVVISSHNLEHCNKPYLVAEAMAKALRKNGRAYISFPSKESVKFPKGRKGTLNFFDDPTHQKLIDCEQILKIYEKYGFAVEKKVRNNRPFISRMIGMINEKKSARDNIVLRGTWEYWGFETIIWLKRN